ncbi:MAG TPA: hypothetical protein PLO67_09475 [Saprospiraceae bacterium]|nr:hypothetical protein [Saprospiraceae bacterium]
MLKRRRQLSVYAVAGSDWMKYRPYKRFDPAYDSYYLRLSDSVFRELISTYRSEMTFISSK